MTSATAQAGEFFQFAPGHNKSAWFKFVIPTRRSATIEMAISAGSVITNPGDAGVTVYLSPNCVPGSGSKLGAFISSGFISNPCLEPGTYLIQVTGSAALNASVFLKVHLGCPNHPIDSKYDCPTDAYVFNGGLPIVSSAASDPHNIECQSIEDASEYNCLTLANKTLYVKSSWYVFTTGSAVDFMDVYFTMGTSGGAAGYRLLEGNVRNSAPSTLTQIDCGNTKARFADRYIEFPCILKPNTTYSLAIVFHRDFSYSNMVINVRQRSENNSGWPKPTLPPNSPSNQLGTLAATPSPGLISDWTDRFNCNSFIIDNVCAPANPASGTIVIGSGATATTFDMTTWATFTLNEDSNVEFKYTGYHAGGAYYTRVFRKTLGNACPSPNLTSDLYFAFPSIQHLEKCMPAGDYSIQVLSASKYAYPPHTYFDNGWDNANLGTSFTLSFTVVSLPDVGLFRLDAPGAIDPINALNPMQNGVTYNAAPSVFICENTVLPASNPCMNRKKAIYREINIGDANNDGTADDGLLCMSNLRVDLKAAPPIFYGFYKGDANQLATAAGTHSAGEVIPGLVDYAGFCIDQDDDTLTLKGLPNFCACVTSGIYTLASYGNVDNVSKGDEPLFKFNIYNTVHDSRPKAEEIFVGTQPGFYSSTEDYFSCKDNPGVLTPCNGSRKLIYREFFLSEPAVAIISETGSAGNVISLYTGRATDANATLTAHTECFGVNLFYDYCTPLEAGWYTVISYGNGPNYTTSKVLGKLGDPGDVGFTSRITIQLLPVVIPNYNLSDRAYEAGITDWLTPPPANVNALTRKIYQFPNDTFCDPDFPFIPDTVAPCAPGYNRISMYVFEITKPSFVQIRNLALTYYTAVYPFDVNVSPELLLTVPPVYPCVSLPGNNRQLCDIPPGKYTIAIFANDTHKGSVIAPAIYVDEAAQSRFDHVWSAYDFDLVPSTNVFVNGKLLDTHPTLPGQAPSRDLFYCTTGATINDPNETQCEGQLNDLIYAQPAGVPKPLFLQNDPLPQGQQPWRNLWYTFKLSGSGICTLHTEVLMGPIYKPLIAVYESIEDGTIPWSNLQTSLMDPANTIIPGLKLVKSHVTPGCDAFNFDLVFNKSGCIRDNVRYYVVATFDTRYSVNPPNLPNQAISISLKYDPRPTFAEDYDERSTANTINGLMETAPPYTAIKLAPGDSFSSVDFSLLCYTKNVTDPPGCDPTKSGKSAWFTFEAAATGHFYAALQELGTPNGWFANEQDLTLWKELSPGGALEQVTMDSVNVGGHEWVDGCIDRGVYYLLVRHCLRIDTIQPYRAVIQLTDSPGDYCSNAILVNVVDNNPVTGSTLIDCHTIGTDVGESVTDGNACFNIQGRKTTWFRAIVNAGPMVDLNFQLSENFQGSAINLNDLSYRILSGNCGAMTPIVCSASGTNVITLNCLAPGEYYVQVSMPEKTGGANSPELKGTLMLTITATPADPLICTNPFDPNQILADFAIDAGCDSVSFLNLSTTGPDITYLWEFPNETSTEVNPTWTPPGPGSYMVTLTVTNIVTGTTTIKTLTVDFMDPFADYTPLPDGILCNHMGEVRLDATLFGATYQWNSGSTSPIRIATVPGTYWVIIRKDGCELRDTALVTMANAIRSITTTICDEDSLVVHGQVFNKALPSGQVIVPGADPSGCDSILNVGLQFFPSANTQLAQAICDGDSYTFGNQTLTQSGTYVNMLSTSHGCDSIVTLFLTVKSKVLLDHVVAGCQGSTVWLNPETPGVSFLWDNALTTDSILVTADGTYTVSVSDIDNCVIAEESFTVTLGQLAPPLFALPAFLCPGSDIQLTATGSSGSYQWFDDALGQHLIGTGSPLVLPHVTQNVTLYVMAYDPTIANCESNLVPVPIVLEPEPTHAVQDEIICAGTSLLLPWGESVTPSADDSYIHAWQNAVTGCDSFDLTVNVALIHLPDVNLPSSFTLQYGDSVLLVPQIDFLVDSVRWSPADGLSCTDCTQPWASPEESTDYQLTAWSIDGCVTTAVISIEVRHDVNIYIPNVFTPNGDGTNDIFTAYGNREVKLVRRLLIYDRWGDAVWQGENFQADGSFGWDGLFRGQPMQPGVMAWVCEIEFADGTTRQFAGDVTLIR